MCGCDECSCKNAKTRMGYHYASQAQVPVYDEVISAVEVAGPVKVLGIASVIGLVYYTVAHTLLTGF